MGNTILINRNLVEKALPFPADLKYHDYWLSIINECYGVRVTISKSLVKYRLHAANSSNNNKLKTPNKTLPFMQDNRLKTIEFLLKNYQLEENDGLIVKRFYSYLSSEKGRFSDYIFLLKNDFFKSSSLYRLNAFFRIMSGRVN